MKIKLMIVDDHRIMRDGLKVLLEKEDTMRIVGEAGNGRQALDIIKHCDPDILIIDIAMPELNGIETVKRIKKIKPTLKIIVLSMYSHKTYVEQMLLAGINGYVLKDCAFKELTRAINAVYRNGVFLSDDVTGVLVHSFVNEREGTADGWKNENDLSAREREVLQLLAEGKNTKEIALELHISIKTVEAHRRQIMNKLDLYNLADLVKYAIREGIILP